MEGSLGAALDVTTGGSGDFAAFVQLVSTQAALLTVGIAAALLLISLVAELCGVNEGDAGFRGAPGAALAAAAAAAAGASEAAAGATPVSVLRGFGLSPTDATALTAKRGGLRYADWSSDSDEARHLAFARWLAENGRIAG